MRSAAGGVAVAATVSCAVGAASCDGTAKADTLVGSAGPDTISARAGDDVARGGAGNDFAGCGPGGGDRAFADSRDEMDGVSCEMVKYPAEATGVLQRIEIAPYSYGTHYVRDETTGVFYALEAESPDLDSYKGRRVAVGGMTRDWTEIFGPSLMTVTSLEER